MTNPVELTQCAKWLSQQAAMPVNLVASIDSTNSALLRGAVTLPIHPEVACALVALGQTAGRGRLGRHWQSDIRLDEPTPPTFSASLGIRTRLGLPSLGLLPLQIGVAVAEQLRAWGSTAQLKWPNDLVIETPKGSAKLGGILVETRNIGDAHAVVMGLGLNWHSAPVLVDKLTDCVLNHAPNAPSAQAACAALLAAMQLGWQRSVEQTACSFSSVDALLGKSVTIQTVLGPVNHGIAKGINHLGHLGVQTDEGLLWLHSGEVSIRMSR